MDASVAGIRERYANSISELFGGMASQYPEAARVLESAAKQYDLSAAFADFETWGYGMEVSAEYLQMSDAEKAAYEEAYRAKQEAANEYMYDSLSATPPPT